MSFLDAFEDVFTEPENVITGESQTKPTDLQEEPHDYFDRDDEPVVW